MADDKQFSDDEYQFSDLDTEDTYEVSAKDAEAAASADAGAGRKRVFFIIGIIVAGLAVYKLLGVFLTSTEKKAPDTPTVVVTKPKPVVISKIPQSVSTNMSQLQRKASENSSKINMLQSRVADVQSSLVLINENLTTIADRMQSMQQQVAELKKPEVKKAVIKKRTKRVHKRRHIKPPPVYHVNAIIPGRAWLRATNGTTITVSEGQTLTGYGKIINISPQDGRVTTSSGREITFSPEDS